MIQRKKPVRIKTIKTGKYRVKGDHPPYDSSWGVNITHDLIDYVVRESGGILKGLGVIERKTDIWWARRILLKLVEHGEAPKKADMSWHCIETLCNSEWIWEYIAKHGVEVNRGEIQRRRESMI